MESRTDTNTGPPSPANLGSPFLERMELDLESLRAFGAAADVPDGPNIRMEEGGFIIPGRVPVPSPKPGKKGRQRHAKPRFTSRKRANRRSETRATARAARATAGAARATAGAARATAIATGSSSQTFGRRLSALLRLEELERWYPSARIVRCSSGLALMSVDVGVIRSLPYRGQLFLEIPLHDPLGPIPFPAFTTLALVPTVRVWASWHDCVRPTGDHVYPDASICAYMAGEWVWGRDPLHVLVDWCTCWLAKSLHLSFLNRWPGRQHCSAWVAMKRDMLDEYCRCGGPKQYKECHYPKDRQRTSYELAREERAAAACYLREVGRRGWAPTPPWAR